MFVYTLTIARNPNIFMVVTIVSGIMNIGCYSYSCKRRATADCTVSCHRRPSTRPFFSEILIVTEVLNFLSDEICN